MSAQCAEVIADDRDLVCAIADLLMDLCARDAARDAMSGDPAREPNLVTDKTANN